MRLQVTSAGNLQNGWGFLILGLSLSIFSLLTFYVQMDDGISVISGIMGGYDGSHNIRCVGYACSPDRY